MIDKESDTDSEVHDKGQPHQNVELSREKSSADDSAEWHRWLTPWFSSLSYFFVVLNLGLLINRGYLSLAGLGDGGNEVDNNDIQGLLNDTGEQTYCFCWLTKLYFYIRLSRSVTKHISWQKLNQSLSLSLLSPLSHSPNERKRGRGILYSCLIHKEQKLLKKHWTVSCRAFCQVKLSSLL